MDKKPPLGAMPHRLHNLGRISQLTAAIVRYLAHADEKPAGHEYQAHMAQMLEWAEELECLLRFEKNHPGKWNGGNEDGNQNG